MAFDASAACDLSSEQATAFWMPLAVAITFAVFIGIDSLVGFWVIRSKLRQVEKSGEARR